jgi:hypothetical protein
MKPPSRDYEVGYRRPPAQRSFRKGVSGNPGGRPSGSGLARAKALVLKEIYRLVTVREGDKVFRMPALQAVLRQQIALAIKGKGPAGQAMLQLVNQIERELAALTAAEATMVQEHSMSELDIARRIALALELGRQQLERHVQEGSAGKTDERCS